MKKVPVPSHNPRPEFKAGVGALSGGLIFAAVDSFEICILGKSEYISQPDLCIDPVVTAAHVVVRLQSVIAEEIRQDDFAVVDGVNFSWGQHGGYFASFREYQSEIWVI